MTNVLTITGLETSFYLDEGIVRAVAGVDLAIPHGSTVALVGESGCGKSVTALSILRLISPPGQITGGRIILQREKGSLDLTALPDDGEEIRNIRGKEIAMVFQEPMTALSPVHTIGEQISEVPRLHLRLSRKEARQCALQMMARVGIPDGTRRYSQYPHELSGGLRQRVVIAMALCCRPTLLIADEPTTALDVTIQAQILILLRELQQEFGMAILLITHDLGVVAEMAELVAVMYHGRVVEYAGVQALFHKPRHPYTYALLQSMPSRASRKTPLQVIPGGVPDPFVVLPGCSFHPRCVDAQIGICDTGFRPPLCALEPGHAVACLRASALRDRYDKE